jgi:hypothetical protein
MRSYLLFIFLLCLIRGKATAQEHKRSNNWAVGFAPTVIMNFNNDSIRISPLNNLGLTFGNSCLSNVNGELTLISNGFFILDSSGNWIENGDSINTPYGSKLLDYYTGDGFWNQMSIILPKKGNTYYVFTTGMSDWAFDAWKKPDPPFDFRFDVLSCHIVDMDANNGKGKVVERNKVLMQEARLSHNRMSAVRHANGRDWWLVKPHQSKQIFYTFLVKMDTIEGPFELEGYFNMDSVLNFNGLYGIRGQCNFSPDGNWLASTESSYKGAFVYNFDRCNGTLRKYYYFKQPFFDTTTYDWSVGVCFSPDSKLLYLITGANIYQYDLKDTSNSSYIHISGMDTIKENFPSYDLSYLGADNKLYIGNANGTQNGMSYIDKPNERGLACDYKPKGLRQPFTNLLVPPNMPFYGLGALKGSPCDTIGKLQVQEMVIYPNPARDAVKIYLPLPVNTTVKIALYNMLGQEVQRWQANLNTKQEINLQLPYLAFGLYTLKASTIEQEFKGKLLVE